MDMLAIDISEIKRVSIGDSVLIWGQERKSKLLIETVANNAFTIPYVLLCQNNFTVLNTNMSINNVTAYFKSQVKSNEWKPLIWSFLYFYFLLTGYFILRPIREVMGVTAGPENYDMLFSSTFIVMLLIQPIYGKIVSKYSRKQFIPLIYGFFGILILVMWGLFHLIGTESVALARVFFVFVSVYNVFIVSVFWSFMSDVYTKKQGKRLFGVIAAGGSTGGITGGIIAATLVYKIGTINLFTNIIWIFIIVYICSL